MKGLFWHNLSTDKPGEKEEENPALFPREAAMKMHALNILLCLWYTQHSKAFKDLVKHSAS